MRLRPAVCIATNSLSKESRPKAVIEAMIPAIGRVNTRKEGIRWAKTCRTATIPTPLETNSSTKRRSSRVSITKHSAPRLTLKGERSSVKM